MNIEDLLVENKDPLEEVVEILELQFEKKLREHLREEGRECILDRIPKIGYVQLNLRSLYTIVRSFGGYQNCSKKAGCWKRVYDKLCERHGHSRKLTDASSRLRMNYVMFLQSFEEKELKTSFHSIEK